MNLHDELSDLAGRLEDGPGSERAQQAKVERIISAHVPYLTDEQLRTFAAEAEAEAIDMDQLAAWVAEIDERLAALPGRLSGKDRSECEDLLARMAAGTITPHEQERLRDYLWGPGGEA